VSKQLAINIPILTGRPTNTDPAKKIKDLIKLNLLDGKHEI
jgi:hypothetical protein